MSFSLYQATVPTFLQIVNSVAGLLDKAEQHCASNNLPAEELTLATLAPDMFPFAFQVASVAHHSAGAFAGLQAGVFAPNVEPPPTDFAGLRAEIANAKDALLALSADQVNAFVGQPMRFEFREYKMAFTAEEFLFTFTQPNFFFHAATAYDILRWKGLPLGKGDFMGQLRTC